MFGAIPADLNLEWRGSTGNNETEAEDCSRKQSGGVWR